MSDLSAFRVREHMTTDLLTFTPDTDVMSAMGALVKRKHSGAPVCGADGKLLGMLSEKDCLKVAVVATYEGVSPGSVQDFMTVSAACVSPDDTLLDVANRFLDAPFKRFPVVENGKLVGQISRSDLLRVIHENA